MEFEPRPLRIGIIAETLDKGMNTLSKIFLEAKVQKSISYGSESYNCNCFCDGAYYELMLLSELETVRGTRFDQVILCNSTLLVADMSLVSCLLIDSCVPYAYQTLLIEG